MPTQDSTPSSLNLPNVLTVLRILMVPLFLWLLLAEGGSDPRMRLWALGVFVLAMATDALDGHLARKHSLVTDFGKIADPIADKALMAAAFVGLNLIGELPVWISVLVLGREFGITAMRLAILRYAVMPASKGGKLKTVLQTLAVTLYILPLSGAWDWAAHVAMAAALIVTVVTGIQYLLDSRRQTPPTPAPAA